VPSEGDEAGTSAHKREEKERNTLDPDQILMMILDERGRPKYMIVVGGSVEDIPRENCRVISSYDLERRTRKSRNRSAFSNRLRWNRILIEAYIGLNEHNQQTQR
jgi:hypothetical protein